MSRGRYRGRRSSTTPILFIVMLVVLILAIILILINIKKDKKVDVDDTKPKAEQTEQLPTEPEDEPEEDEETNIQEVDTEDDGHYEVIMLDGDRQQYNAVYRIGDAGYEMYAYVESLAKKYTDAINQVGDSLKGVSNVYCMPIPLSSSITMPDELMGSDLFGNQEKACADIEGMLNDNVTAIPLYNILMKHRTEYVYFRTDHHWTGLGAYYAYVKYCKVKGITPHEVAEYQAESYDGYLGSFYGDTGNSSQLGNNPDVVIAYKPISESAKMTVTDKNGSTYEMPIIYDETNAYAGYKYGAFIGGDNPFSVIENPEVTDGSSCIVVKESFGNAIVPLMVDHYSTVYVIDYRYWNGSITNFAKEKNVNDVLFVNNLSAIRGSGHIAELYKVL